MLNRKQIIDHYMDSRILDTIIKFCTDGNISRAGCGDRKGWYIYDPIKKTRRKYNLANPSDYKRMVMSGYRTIYSTLNLFDNGIYEVDYTKGNIKDSPGTSRRYTRFYTFGIDIDKGPGCDIHNPEVKKAVEDMAQYFVDYLKGFGMINYIKVAFSGGGIYILVHHKGVLQYFEAYSNREDWDLLLLTLLDAFDSLIREMRDMFFSDHPEHIGKVKPDELNGSQRIFKTIFSVHAKHDYAVIPLDPANIKINFEDATIPLKQKIIESAKDWYMLPEGLDCYLESGYFLKECLQKHLESAYLLRSSKPVSFPDIDISKIPLADINTWPACMRNLYNLPTCGEGKTRALAVFTSYIGQIGIPEPEAKDMFFCLAQRWKAETSNIFKTHYRRMHTPSCKRLTSDDNRGFPKGVSIKSLGVCVPDSRCLKVSSPRYYTDRKANMERLLVH